MLSLPSAPWQKILRGNFTRLNTLLEFLELDSSTIARLAVRKEFPLNLPRRLAEKIQKNTLEDPIFKQFVPLADEFVAAENFVLEPLSEGGCKVGKKLLHKYQGRVLLVCTSACAMHCRYCFRQNFDYQVQDKGFEQELAYIAEDTTLREVILSGGDPLALTNERLSEILKAVDAIPHITRIRFHTRFPIGIPERIDEGLIALLTGLSKKVWLVVHVNHPLELDQDVLAHLKKLSDKGVMLLNQSVLLKGVNADVEVLEALCNKLVDNNILPYYIHQLDRVKGASHFEVDLEEGKALMRSLQKRVSGYALPRYAQEIPGFASKVIIPF
ncbi:MAG: KamA family radical SAM protein [Parachlamydiales bacterium]